VTCDTRHIQIRRRSLGGLLVLQRHAQHSPHRQAAAATLERHQSSCCSSSCCSSCFSSCPHFLLLLPSSLPHRFTGEFVTISPDIAAASTCPELLRACIIYIIDFGGNLLSESAHLMLDPLKNFARDSSGRDVCASPSMDIWAAAVVAFELMRDPEGLQGAALFGSKKEVRNSVLHTCCSARCFRSTLHSPLQLFENLLIRAIRQPLRPTNLRSELYDTEATRQKAAATTLVVPLHAVKNAHIRAILDAALVTDADERITLDKVIRHRVSPPLVACSAFQAHLQHVFYFSILSAPPFLRCLFIWSCAGLEASPARHCRKQS
jgi:hypothetical protein